MTTTQSLNTDDLRSRFKDATAKAPVGETSDLVMQMRYVLAVSQTNPPLEEPAHRSEWLDESAAQLMVLAQTAGTFPPTFVQQIMRKIEQVDDLSLQLNLKSRLFSQLPPDMRQKLVVSVWDQVVQHPSIDPAVHASVLFCLFKYMGEKKDQQSETLQTIMHIINDFQSMEARLRSLIAMSQHVPADMQMTVQRSVLTLLDNTSDDSICASSITSLSESLLPELVNPTLERALSIRALDERVRALSALAAVVPHEQLRDVQDTALSAIEGIAKEESRLEALTVFLPHLDYAQDADTFPEVLERALSVAVSMTRRSLRARALVVLAPHLPVELQGEALADVHSLPKERDRATLLAELANNLPPKMLVASLAVAHTMQDQDARVHALSALARHVPEQARQQTIKDARDAAVQLPRVFERIAATVDLIDILPDDLRRQSLVLLVNLTADIPNENTRTRALGMIVDHLPDDLLEQASEIAYAIESPQRCLTALLSIVEYMPADRQTTILEDMLALTQDVRHEYEQSRALRNLAPLLPPPLISTALDIAANIDDPYDQLSAIIPLAQSMSDSERPALVRQAWKLVHHIESGYDRASALAAVAPLLPPAAEADLTRAISSAIASITDEYDQASAIILLAPILADTTNIPATQPADRPQILQQGIQLALKALHQRDRIDLLNNAIILWVEHITPDDRPVHDMLWSTLMVSIAGLPLADAILCMGALLPLVEHLGGEKNVQEWRQAMGLRT